MGCTVRRRGVRRADSGRPRERPTAEDRRRDYLEIGAEIVADYSEDQSLAAPSMRWQT